MSSVSCAQTLTSPMPLTLTRARWLARFSPQHCKHWTQHPFVKRSTFVFIERCYLFILFFKNRNAP